MDCFKDVSFGPSAVNADTADLLVPPGSGAGEPLVAAASTGSEPPGMIALERPPPGRAARSSPAVRMSPAPRPATIRLSPALLRAARDDHGAVLATLATTPRGLTSAEAAARLAEHGPNQVEASQRRSRWRALLGAATNPLVALLFVLAVVSAATGDARAAVVMLVMIVLGVALRFVQESRASAAAAALEAMIRVTATVLRDGAAVERPLRDLVPGDVVELAAGDMIPGDVRLLSSKDLFVAQGTLTGESLPVEKYDVVDLAPDRAPLDLSDLCFLGTSVASGTGTAVVVETGARTYLGTMAESLGEPAVATSFDRGIDRFTWLMIRIIGVLVPVVFVVNGLTKHDWKGAFFFALAVAVGLTPEMLPMIVSVCLSRGALEMSKKKVIVKRLDAIQNLGAMDVLCTDKTGTLTLDRVILQYHCDVAGEESEAVLLAAFLVSHYQTGLRNVLDRATLAHAHLHAHVSETPYQKLDEIPFDFSRKMMSVAIRSQDGAHRVLTKGDVDAVLARCTHFERAGETLPVEPALASEIRAAYRRLAGDGFRVLAVASKEIGAQTTCTRDDEQGLVLKGYVAFLDPPKDSARPALAALAAGGVRVKILTGDNELVSRKVCRDVGLEADEALVGTAIDAMSDAELALAAERHVVFAHLSPAHKKRIVETLRAAGHVVGFLGDGINDAPALRAADVGISVDSAVDIAKESADIVLLEKNLMVLEEGVREGRKVFANILKYVRMGASSNFGNMLSVIGASAFLPFVPMAPLQILANNLLYDFSQVAIPTDEVDAEQVARPRPWAIDEIRRFIVLFGPISSIFDYATFGAMWFVFGCRTVADAATFQTGWFVESLVTQTLVIHVIRTRKLPFVQSRASWPLLVSGAAVVLVGLALPLSPLGPTLGFARLPTLYWPVLALLVASYFALTQAVKAWLARKGWI